MPSIKNKRIKPFAIYAIFEKDSQGNYTNDARLYQDILAYIFTDKPHKPFTYHMLTEWLLDVKNQEYREYYSGSRAKTSTWNRIQSTRRRIEKFVQNLVDSGFMVIAGQTKSPKNDIQMPLYGYTTLGQILALVIEYGKTTTDTKKKDKLCDLIFEKIQEYFKLYHSYIGDFLAAFYKKILVKGYKKTIADHLFKILEESDKRRISSLIGAFNWGLYLHLERSPNRQPFTEIFIETLSDLPENAKKAVMLHDKHSIELKILEMTPSKEWSDLWVKNIADGLKLTLYAFCINCKYIYPATVDYLTYLRESDQDGSMKADCLICRAEKKASYVNDIPIPIIDNPPKLG